MCKSSFHFHIENCAFSTIIIFGFAFIFLFKSKSSSIEIVPYHIEYIDDCIIPESDRAYEEDGLMEGEAYETE